MHIPDLNMYHLGEYCASLCFLKVVLLLVFYQEFPRVHVVKASSSNGGHMSPSSASAEPECPINNNISHSFLVDKSNEYDVQEHTSKLRTSFYEEWNSSFPPSSILHSYDESDPLTAIQAINESFAFCSKHLPTDLVSKLLSFPYDPSAPSYLVIRNLPIELLNDVPPTPKRNHLFENEPNHQELVPLALTWILGISRLLGHLTCPPNFNKAIKERLIRSVTQFPHEHGILPMHRDYARKVQAGGIEPEFLILFGIRSDEESSVATVIIDNEELIQLLDQDDIEVLQKFKIQMNMTRKPGAAENDEVENVPIGNSFYAIDPMEKGLVTLYGLPNGVPTSPDGGEAAVAAYKRVEAIAFEHGDRVVLGPGDMLILNNARALHGRTSYDSNIPIGDKSRWMIKSYVTNAMWKGTGTDGSGGRVEYPSLSIFRK